MNRTVDWWLVQTQFVKWFIVCIISAGPSFFWAMALHRGPEQILAIATGILLFIVIYTAIGSSSRMQLARRNKALRVTMRIGYGTRIVLSIIVPVGLFVDLCFGMVATSIIGGVTSGQFTPEAYERSSTTHGFVKVLATTILQGVLLNLALLAYMAIVYWVLKFFLPKEPPKGICPRCGYDLRASSTNCPECGEPVVGPGLPSGKPALAGQNAS